jgi:protein O-mannosyl-transferase
MDRTGTRRQVFISALLSALTLGAFWPVLKCDFVNYDDNYYVTENPMVVAGLTWKGAVWAFTRAHAANWHPVTWLSHMLDCQLYGLNPAGHHLTNLLFHTANAVLLFLLLRRMTGAVWRSAFVAGLFALHPLHAESVAWVAERKDVLSAFFFMLTLWAYVRYAEQSKAQCPKVTTYNPQSAVQNLKPNVTVGAQTQATATPGHASRFTFHVSRYYLLALLLFALGLMSKPMLVTVPFVLLLLDYWPLARFPLKTQNSKLKTTPGFLPLLFEKLPFLVLSIGSCVATVLAQKQGGAMVPLEALLFGTRLATALMSYVQYLGKVIWPNPLAVIYLPAQNWADELALGAGLLMLAVSAWVTGQRRKRGYLLVGWFWFVGTLVPVIGLVQVGNQTIADRYTYIPALGLFIALAWGADELSRRWSKRHLLLPGAGMVLLLACVVGTRTQVACWKDSGTLFRHALAVTGKNFVAYTNLGNYLARQRDFEGAVKSYRSALEIRPDFPTAWNGLGTALAAQEKYDEAKTAYQAALRFRPRFADAFLNLGLVCALQNNLDEAVSAFSQAVQFRPDNAAAQYQLALALSRQNKTAEAVTHYRMALSAAPDFPEALNNVAWILASSPKPEIRDGREAVWLAQRACALTEYKQALLIGTLAAAYAESGRFAEAVATAEKARALAEQNHEPELAAKNAELIELYRSGKPFRDTQ